MSDTPHKRVHEYDGSFKCFDCQARWGALPGHPQMPAECIAPVKSQDRDAYEGCREDLSEWKRRALKAEEELRGLEPVAMEMREALRCWEIAYGRKGDPAQSLHSWDQKLKEAWSLGAKALNSFAVLGQ